MAVVVGDVSIIMDNPPADPTLTVFLTSAQNLVTDANCTAHYSATIVDEITKYLAAHFAATVRPPKTEETALQSTDIFVQPAGHMLNNSRYGEMVLMFDPEGLIRSRMGKKAYVTAMA